MILLVKVILAHILGDFLLQPNSWVKAKENKKALAWQLYAHVCIHGLLTLLLLFDITDWKLVVVIVLSHLIIDYVKLKFQTENSKITWFIIDQMLHLSVIIFLGLYWQDKEKELLELLLSNSFITLTTAVLFLTQPVSIIMSVLIKPWSDTISNEKEKSLKNAGKYIGILERLLVFLFICTHHFEAVGFLLATKSVFRFGDLKESKERKLTEYILIGTLLSFGIALLVGLLSVYLLKI
ncbi:DUF3307 domain-containing protein [Flavobacterium sp. ZT3R18]|uniref:DUF3307 domain-containing protein n=1 Tax=Flavobacterium sp. ZT3R18 TaxID=2594429 RepID=UPI00117AA18D|nr:DUF3307 domain-containing protein [Flavobacterium sp. ZT3R18]TRX36128.1 DUF3307 domain-containing protein [Flavobacterium sp. ZT3R18]